MANVAVNSPYALNAVVVSEVFYDLDLGYWFAVVFVLATQLTGFGLAGLCRRFLVWPASMVWPQNLVACTLLNTLHAEDEDDGIGMAGTSSGKGMSRYRFFMIVTIGSFFWFFFPGKWARTAIPEFPIVIRAEHRWMHGLCIFLLQVSCSRDSLYSRLFAGPHRIIFQSINSLAFTPVWA